MSAFAFGGMELARAGTGVDSGGFDNDTAILDKSLDMCTRISIADFFLLGRVKPNFTLSDTCDACGEAFL